MVNVIFNWELMLMGLLIDMKQKYRMTIVDLHTKKKGAIEDKGKDRNQDSTIR